MKSDRERARAAVLSRMSALGLDTATLAAAAQIDPGTAGDFLSGERWPQISTRAKLDRALQWEPGTITAMAAGAELPDVSRDGEDRRMLLNVDPAIYSDLSEAELVEAMSTATAVFLQKVREIRAARPVGYTNG